MWFSVWFRSRSTRTGSRPPNHGKGGLQIIWGSSEKHLQRCFAQWSTILDSGKLILSHFCDTSSVNPVLINDFESIRLAGEVLRTPRRVTTWCAEKTGWIPGFKHIESVFGWIQAGKKHIQINIENFGHNPLEILKKKAVTIETID